MHRAHGHAPHGTPPYHQGVHTHGNPPQWPVAPPVPASLVAQRQHMPHIPHMQHGNIPPHMHHMPPHMINPPVGTLAVPPFQLATVPSHPPAAHIAPPKAHTAVTPAHTQYPMTPTPAHPSVVPPPAPHAPHISLVGPQSAQQNQMQNPQNPQKHAHSQQGLQPQSSIKTPDVVYSHHTGQPSPSAATPTPTPAGPAGPTAGPVVFTGTHARKRAGSDSADRL